MRLSTLRWLSLLLGVLPACSSPAPDRSRERVAAALRDTLGTAADPQVAFRRAPTHLLIHLDSTVFAGLPDSAFASQARKIAYFALRQYDRRAEVDSVTVLEREVLAAGQVMRDRRWRTFPTAALLESSRH